MYLLRADTGLMRKGNFPSSLICYFVFSVTAIKNPLFEFRICSPDRLSVNITVQTVTFLLVRPVEPVDVVGSVEPPVGDKDDPAVFKILFSPFL